MLVPTTSLARAGLPALALMLAQPLPASAQLLAAAGDSLPRPPAPAAVAVAVAVEEGAEGGEGGFLSRLPRTLRRSGVELSVAQTSDGSLLRLAGEREAVARSLVAVDLAVDLETVLGVPATRLFAQHQSLWGRDGSAALGDAQGFSNIDAEEFARLYELFVEHGREDGPVRIKVGRIDSNTEFAVSAQAGNFVHPSMALSPTLFTAPTYPEPVPAANLFVRPGAGVALGVGAFLTDPARPRSRFLVAEAGRAWETGRLGVGAWHQREGDAELAGHAGWYAVLDQVAWSGGEEGREVAAFARYGSADASATELSAHLAGGVRGANLIPLAPADELGLGATWAGRSLRERGIGELAVEGYLRVSPREWFGLQAHLQHIRARGLPGGLSPEGDWVATIRVVLGG